MPDKPMCSDEVYDSFGFDHNYSCTRHGTVFEDGKWWCKQHSPSGVKAREEKSARYHDERARQRHEKWAQERERERHANCFDDLVAALEQWHYQVHGLELDFEKCKDPRCVLASKAKEPITDY
jgi:hypothetical protein